MKVVFVWFVSWKTLQVVRYDKEMRGGWSGEVRRV